MWKKGILIKGDREDLSFDTPENCSTTLRECHALLCHDTAWAALAAGWVAESDATKQEGTLTQHKAMPLR